MNDLGGIDFGQYQSWEQIKAPTGATYYVVPGTGFVYDPFLSGVKGRPVLWTNPSPAVKEKEDAKKFQEEQGSIGHQLIPVAGSTLGTVGGAYAINALTTPSSAAPVVAGSAPAETSAAGEAFAGGAAAGGGGATSAGATAGSQAAWNAGADAFSAGSGAGAAGAAPSAPVVVGGGSTAGGEAGALAGSLGVAAGAGAVGAFYGPSYAKYGSKIASGKADSDDWFKSALLSNLLTAWIVPVMDYLHINTATGKDTDQLRRDIVRKHLKDNGILDDKYNITYSDGSSFDFGKDGKDAQYNIDFKSGNVNDDAVSAASALAAIVSAGDPKLTSDFAGEYYNATKGPNQQQKLIETFQKHGFGFQDAAKAIEALSIGDKPKIDAATRDNMLVSLSRLYGEGTFKGQAAGAPGTFGTNFVNGTQPIPMDREGGRNAALGQQLAARINASGGQRVSPGVYKDAKTGQTYLSKDGRR